MTSAELQLATQAEAEKISPEALALWHAKQGNWDAAHNIAQDIPTKTGSWIHALLHVVEGDQWNADYWFAKAGRPSYGSKEIDKLWDEIATVVLS